MTVWLFSREGVAKSPCKCGYGGGIYIEDIPGLKAIIDYEKHPCEWATKIGRTSFISALYILNNDFSIMVYLPQDIAPTEIITELED